MHRLQLSNIPAGTTKGDMLLMVCTEGEARHMDITLPQAWLDGMAERAEGDTQHNYEMLRIGTVWDCENWQAVFLTDEAYAIAHSAINNSEA